ncbi:putative dUTPase [Lactococcus phage BK5-T]|uniref:DUPTase, putative n=1 Tax=Lactococcus phage BK5-T TaxID=31754 RepID=Q94M88_9CAUD|nr:putative dUTPase [Lactococcus phage BK5-T]YP_010133273.1 dUPTase, putative [Lactococcus phage BK5-T]AAK56831.1 putative dUTPase [Lactococcus phage BK5-T]CAC80194.1 dUPTase, putative [Lactococcus phage BK5-T]
MFSKNEIRRGDKICFRDTKFLKVIEVTDKYITVEKDQFTKKSVKRGIALINSVGIIDSDYYPQEFKGLFMNISKEPVTISKGQRIMQGVFVKYLTTDDDNANGKRTGGFGSTGEV